MNWTRFILAAVAGFVALFAIGFVWHVPLLGSYYAEMTSAIALPAMALPTLILAEIIRALVMAYIYPIGFKGGAPALEGLRFGVLMGLFSAMFPLFNVSQYNFTSYSWFWVEGVFFVIQCAVAGVVIAYAYGAQSGKG